jgi:PhnB protein
MIYYRACFGGDLTLQTIAETPMAAQCPAGMQEHIMHSELRNNDFVIMATDMVGQGGFVKGTDMAISLNFDNEDEARKCFEKLSTGGEVIDGLKESSWGSLFGVVKDKFDKVWMFNHELKTKP